MRFFTGAEVTAAGFEISQERLHSTRLDRRRSENPERVASLRWSKIRCALVEKRATVADPRVRQRRLVL
jgi:ribosomal protein L13E